MANSLCFLASPPTSCSQSPIKSHIPTHFFFLTSDQNLSLTQKRQVFQTCKSKSFQVQVRLFLKLCYSLPNLLTPFHAKKNLSLGTNNRPQTVLRPLNRTAYFVQTVKARVRACHYFLSRVSTTELVKIFF